MSLERPSSSPVFRVHEDDSHRYVSDAKLIKELVTTMDEQGRPMKKRDWYAYYDPFKLHIYIHPDEQNRIRFSLEQLLKQAILNKTIAGYKLYIEPEDSFSKMEKRLTHWGTTVYLPATYTREIGDKLIILCKDIQNLLSKYQASLGEFIYLEDCDLRVSSNIAFRCTTTNPDEKDHKYYFANSGTAPSIMRELKRAGERSQYYQHLRQSLNSEMKTATRSSRPFFNSPQRAANPVRHQDSKNDDDLIFQMTF